MKLLRQSRLRGGFAVAWLALLVLALHLTVLGWLGQAVEPLASRRLPEPIYTQILRPTPPPQPPRAATPPPAPLTPRPTPAPPPAPTVPLPEVAGPVALAAATVPDTAPATAASVASAPSPTSPTSAASAAAVSAPDRAVSAPAPAASAPRAEPSPAWPPSTRLTYTISGQWRGALHGSGALIWTVDGDRYDTELSGNALIGFTYRSTGRIDRDWLAPERYTERVFTREKSVRFNRASGTLHFSASAEVLPLPPHVQDSASLFLQLAHHLSTRPEDFRPGATLTFAVARPSGLTDWTFTIAGMDTVDTPLGPLRCWHVVRQATQSNELGAQIWLSPLLQNLPVQIRLQQSAEIYLLFTLDHAQQTGQAAKSSAPIGQSSVDLGTPVNRANTQPVEQAP
ncbi:MAG: DUF3108 domain-containing protein [Thiomonas sp.]